MSYQKVVPLLKNELDWKSICFEIAATNPGVFYEGYIAATKLDGEELDHRLIDCLGRTRNNKIKAVKLHRELTGSTLNDALEYVNHLIESLNL